MLSAPRPASAERERVLLTCQAWEESVVTQKSALPLNNTDFFFNVNQAPFLPHTDTQTGVSVLADRPNGTQIKKIPCAPMTPTSSFTSCLLGITESNHLYYSTLYSDVQTTKFSGNGTHTYHDTILPRVRDCVVTLFFEYQPVLGTKLFAIFKMSARLHIKGFANYASRPTPVWVSVCGKNGVWLSLSKKNPCC
jgi:hypothetical protein